MFNNKSKNNNNNHENEKDPESTNSLWSWVNGKTGSIALGLAAGYALWKMGIIKKVLKGASNLFRRKEETGQRSNSSSS
jgi:hypothetical protein